ncbi:DDE-domain-containing protein [Gyrodon lividus]|nr:DDE-domain-containing protein [Gyrodon lividus]
MPAEKCKPRTAPTPYNRQPKKSKPKDTPPTPALAVTSTSWQNLTLSDWLTVFAYIGAHPLTPQADVVKHFQTQRSGALIFTQSMLSRKLKERPELEKRIVTHPDVERALFPWVKHMEGKGEQVSGPMLKEKRNQFEELFNVPNEEQLSGEGWLAPFCHAYKIHEHCWHGGAGSVDLAAVLTEQKQCQGILSKFAPQDRWNFNETSLFPFAPPDRGLSTKQMSGKKKEKFQITLGLACNADGSEKFDPIYIGKSWKPRCFQKQTPEQWVKKFYFKMCCSNHHVCLFINNFSGHSISYQPTNIQVELFEPNMTPFVQPCDAGIICCFKALYRKNFCQHAIDLDEGGEHEIYKLNILEGMMMARHAWDQVSSETMKHCWDHTQIQL